MTRHQFGQEFTVLGFDHIGNAPGRDLGRSDGQESSHK